MCRVLGGIRCCVFFTALIDALSANVSAEGRVYPKELKSEEIWWLHVQKTGTSFANVLGYYSCPDMPKYVAWGDYKPPGRLIKRGRDGKTTLASRSKGETQTRSRRTPSLIEKAVEKATATRSNTSGLKRNYRALGDNSIKGFKKECHKEFGKFQAGHLWLPHPDKRTTAEGKPFAFVTMLRHPMKRLVSGYFHNLHTCFKEEELFEGHYKERTKYWWHLYNARKPLAELNVTSPDVASFLWNAKDWLFPRYYQCVTGIATEYIIRVPRKRQVAGYQTQRQVAAKVAMARKQLETFAYVGITDEWSKSVCLFHTMFGGTCQDVELFNNRPSTAHDYPRQLLDWAASNAEIQRMAANDPDYGTFGAALDLFWSRYSDLDVASKCSSMCNIPDAADIGVLRPSLKKYLNMTIG